ncbi:hypothetical protein LX36DRAFT_229055 [Colletotrichum falcatum]|nr:hypothetical protein LX36DRAFT_229055 [Colletotrichum falcatum]
MVGIKPHEPGFERLLLCICPFLLYFLFCIATTARRGPTIPLAEFSGTRRGHFSSRMDVGGVSDGTPRPIGRRCYSTSKKIEEAGERICRSAMGIPSLFILSNTYIPVSHTPTQRQRELNCVLSRGELVTCTHVLSLPPCIALQAR